MFSKIIIFLKETKIEMKRVNWLTRKELTNFTMAVIAFSLAVAILLGFLDYVFRLILSKTLF